MVHTRGHKGEPWYLATGEREISDIFAIQDETSGVIVSALTGRFLGSRELSVTQHATENRVAYDQRAPLPRSGFGDALQKAIGYFAPAIAADSSYEPLLNPRRSHPDSCGC